MMEVAQQLILLMRAQARSRFKGGGAHIGVPKAVNGQELSSSADTPDSIVYQILESSDDYLAVTIETGPGVWWTFRLRRGEPSIYFGEGMSVDAFPNDANASLDTDGDGQPDDWNPGYDGTGSSLTVDDDDDGDGVPDELDDLPKDANDSVDTDGDGVGDSTDSDDDGDNFDDQTEVNSGTNPLDRAEYPFSGGRIGLVSHSDYTDRNRDFVDVLIARHGSSQGEVSIDYRTVDGGSARPGEHFEMVSGTLTWADGDRSIKTVQVPLLGQPGGTKARYDFGVLSKISWGMRNTTPPRERLYYTTMQSIPIGPAT